MQEQEEILWHEKLNQFLLSPETSERVIDAIGLLNEINTLIPSQVGLGKSLKLTIAQTIELIKIIQRQCFRVVQIYRTTKKHF